MAFKRYCDRCKMETEHHDDRGVIKCSLCVWKRINRPKGVSANATD